MNALVIVMDVKQEIARTVHAKAVLVTTVIAKAHIC
jgi:hypothetical protein